MKTKQFTSTDVKKIADLARIPVSKTEKQTLASGFSTTLTVVDKMADVDVTGVEPTSQVTGLENVFREDEIDISRTFSQEQALANTRRAHNGFFVKQK